MIPLVALRRAWIHLASANSTDREMNRHHIQPNRMTAVSIGEFSLGISATSPS
jgi:hypothetical protein